MLHAPRYYDNAGSGSTSTLLLLVVSLLLFCCFDVYLASPTTVYDSFLPNNGLPSADVRREVVRPGENEQQPELPVPQPPVQQQLLGSAAGGGGSVTWVPWYGLTEPADIVLLAGLLTVAVLGVLVFAVLVINLRAKVRQAIRDREEGSEERLRLRTGPGLTASNRFGLLELSVTGKVGGRESVSKVREPAQGVVLIETVKPVPVSCVAVKRNCGRENPPPADTRDGPYRGVKRIEQQLNLSDKQPSGTVATQRKRHIPPEAVTMSAIGTTLESTNQLPSPVPQQITPATAAAEAIATTVSLVGDNKEQCLQQLQPITDDNSLQSQQPQQQQPQQPHPQQQTRNQRNVLKRQAVAEISLTGPLSSVSSPNTAYIQLLTPSSASSLSSSATTTDNNATPTKTGSGGPLSGTDGPMAARFGFSPRSIHSFPVPTATYFRFPDVDDFTPTPRTIVKPSAIGDGDSSSTPPAVDAFSDPSERDPVVVPPPKKSSPPVVAQPAASVAEVRAPQPASPSVQPPEVEKEEPKNDEKQPIAEEALTIKEQPRAVEEVRSTARMCAPLANRRVRLKSISLDSEGARLVEENLTSTIPVQELVGIAQQRGKGSAGVSGVGSAGRRFDCVLDDNEEVVDDDDDDDDDDDREHNYETDSGAGGRWPARTKRVRNILNLRLNIPPLGSTPVGSQSTGSMVLDQETATMTARPVATSVSNPAMYPAQMAAHHQHHQSNLLPSRYLGQEEASEQFYFEYFDYGDDDDDDEEEDDETGDEYEGEDGRERFAESEDNNNNSSNNGSSHNNHHSHHNHNNNGGGRSRPALPPAPKTPTLSQSKQKASSLDSDSKVKIYIPYGVSTGSVSCSGGLSVMSIAQSQPQGMATTHNTYAHQSHHQHQHHQPMALAPSSHQTQYGHHQQQQQHQGQQQQLQPRRVSSASVPTTPKRYQYRSAIGHSYYHHHSQHYHQQQQQQQHYQSGQSKLKAAFCGDQGTTMRKDKSVIGLNNSSSSSTTLGTEEGKEGASKVQAGTSATTTTGRSSILQRRGSNHSLTLNLDIYHRGGSVDLTGSNCSLQQHRGSYKNLHQAHSQSQLYQQYSDAGTTMDRGSTVRVQCHQASPQGGGGNTVGEAVGNGATTGIGGAPANNNNNNNNNNNGSKKNLLQRRGSNTSLTLNLRSGVVGGGGGSTFGLNRFSSHNALHTTHMSALGTGTGSYLQQQQQQQTAGHGQHGQQHGQYGQSGSGLVRPAGSRKSLLERRNSNASLTLINVHQRTLSVSNCNLRSGSICSLNSLLTTHTQNETGAGAGGAMMLEEDELDCTGAAGSGEHDNGHDCHRHHHHHHHHHHQHHMHHQQGMCHRHRGVGAGGRYGGSIDAGIDGPSDATAGRLELAGETGAPGGQGHCGRSIGGRLTIAMGQGTSMDIVGSTGEGEAGCSHRDSAGGVGAIDYQRHGRQRKFRSSDSLHNINAREQGLQSGCLAVQRDTNLGHQEQLMTEAKLMACGSRYEDRHHYGSSENFKHPSNRLSTHRTLFHKDPSTVTAASSANNLTALGTGSQCCGSSCCCCCCSCCCCFCGGQSGVHGAGMHGGVHGDGCCDGNGGGLIVKTGNLSISNSNIRNISTKPLSPQTTSEDFKIYLANIQFLQNASNVLTIAYLRKLHNFFSKTYRKMVTAASSHKPSQDQLAQRRHSSSKQPPPLPSPPVTDKLEETRQTDPETGGACSTKMMLLHSDSLHHPPVCDDESYDEEHKKMVLKIHQEFWDLPTNYQEKPLVFGSQAKNRYKTILPNEHSRVILSPERASIVTSEPYINANYIKGPDYANNSYIATQGPLPNTIYEFWLMVHQNIVRTAAAATATTTAMTENCSTEFEQKIVMLTNFVENGRQKCAIYFPKTVGEWLAFGCTADVDVSGVLEEKDAIKQATGGPMTVRCASSFFLVQNIILEQRNGYTVRTLSVIYGSRERPEAGVKPPTTADGTTSISSNAAASFDLIHFRAQHYWFPDWPDHRSPNDINVLLDLSLDVLGSNVRAPGSTGDLPETPGASSPTVDVLPIIHCSAGIGRTGCLIAILNGLRQLRLSVMSRMDGDRKRRLRGDAQVDASSLLSVAAPPSHSAEQPKAMMEEVGGDDAGGFLADDDGSLEPSIPLPPVPCGRGNGSKATMCSSGSNGRSGSGASSLSREIGQVDILGIVCNLRLQRGGMVQNSEQYELIHRALCLYLEKLTQEKRAVQSDGGGLGDRNST
ncbi:uncharacterized protein LOC125954695 [Anopheles darlingi]|uniref:uncharacterized protein LOC125954695 n=1 Tax=Anopheles darlingi TaxID=43151 RepID=UPI0021003C13|nr:uncharacterized protein LOC125954695 [Anopheles darlingi]XP_049541145.1 uncharacterized protein LOC125954695 [Anopheles darlingi]